MKKQRIIGAVLSVCMILCLAACGSNPAKSPKTEAQQPTSSSAPTEKPNDQKPEEIRLLTLEKTLHTNFEWADDFDKALVRSEYSCVTLGQEEAKTFPEMAEIFIQTATMTENAMTEEFENLVTLAGEKLAQGREDFETCVSTLDVQVRRADSAVISLLSDSYSHYGQIENFRAFHGSNYDPKTGEALTLDDVVKAINNDLAQAVKEELASRLRTEEFFSESAVEDYFANTPYDGFSWTMDYNGLTFYFSKGDLCDDMLTATVSFAKHPELFVEKYMVAPTQYTVELAMDLPLYTELDGDGALDELSVSGWYNEIRNAYEDYGVYRESADYYEERFVHDYHPYYVKTESGHYLYLFCEDFQEGWRTMELVVFNLTEDGRVIKTGERSLSPSWLADNRFIVPTDPNRLVLDDQAQGTEKQSFSVGNDGLPTN